MSDKFDINRFKNIKLEPGASKTEVYGIKYFVDHLAGGKVRIKFAEGDRIIVEQFPNLDDMTKFIFSRGNV